MRATVQFPTKVKYRGSWYPAHSPFKVNLDDVDMLKTKGAIVHTVAPIEKEVDELGTAGGADIPPVEDASKAANTAVDIPTKTELLNMKSSAIKEYAVSLGVDLAGCTNNEQRVAKIMEHFSI